MLKFLAPSVAPALLAIGLLVVPASSQDLSQSPSGGQVALDSGFTPDPYQVNIVAGGSVNASRLGNGCTGMIANAPDFRLIYSAGSLPLSIRAIGEVGSDTALVINTPNGDWVCDDDSFGDLDPKVVFRRPQSGQYDIWVASVSGTPADTVLQITETD